MVIFSFTFHKKHFVLIGFFIYLMVLLFILLTNQPTVI